MKYVNISNTVLPAEFVITAYQVVNSIFKREALLNPAVVAELNKLKFDPFLDRNESDILNFVVGMSGDIDDRIPKIEVLDLSAKKPARVFLA